MKLNAIILLVILSITFFVTFWWEDLTVTHKAYKGEFQIAPNFSYQDLNGTSGELYQYKDKVVLIHFWATWCAPCLVEFPEIVQLAQKFPNKLVVLAISADREQSDIERFFHKKKIGSLPNFITIHDTGGYIMTKAYGVDKLPESFLLAHNFHIVDHALGASDQWSNSNFHSYIDLLSIGGKSVYKK